jgi:hypothetical protein
MEECFLETRNIKSVLVVFGLVVAFVVSTHKNVEADAIQKNTTEFACDAELTFPEGKEELTLFDVEQSVKQFLLRIGSPERIIKVKWNDDEDVAVEIFDQLGKKRRHMIVDAATADIILTEGAHPPVGFAGDVVSKTAKLELLDPTEHSKYRHDLRRHMLGDGKSWADWVDSSVSNTCFDDYRFGAPELEPGL